MSLDADICATIAAAVAALTYGTNLFDGPVRPPSAYVPAACVFVMTSGGPPPQEYNGCPDANLNPNATQVWVRYNVDDYANGKILADAVYASMRKATPTSTIGAKALQSAPFYIGPDKDGHHEWSLNFRVWKHE